MKTASRSPGLPFPSQYFNLPGLPPEQLPAEWDQAQNTGAEQD